MAKQQMTSLGLDDLMSQAQDLTSISDALQDDLPFVHKDLNILSRGGASSITEPLLGTGRTAPLNTGGFFETDQTHSRHVPSTIKDTKATLLLGLKGKELPSLQENVHSLSSKAKIEPSHVELDVDSYCKNMREKMMMAMLEDTKQKLIKAGHAKTEDAIAHNWNNTKKGILNFLKGTSSNQFDFVAEDAPVFHSADLRERSALTNEEMAYASEVYKYHEAGLVGVIKPDLVQLCASGAQLMNNSHAVIIWQLVAKILNISVPIELKMNTINGRLADTFQTAFLCQAIGYLEESYLDYIYKQVSQDKLRAEIGGRPGVGHIIRAYLSLSMGKMLLSNALDCDSLHGEPVWPLIYLSLRSGQLELAVQIANEASASLAELLPIITEYATNSRMLSTSSQVKVQIMYQSLVNASDQDAYKRVCLAVIGKCDSANDHRSVIKNTEDYLWLKLNVVGMSNVTRSDQDQLTLKKLQVLLYEELGEAYFKASQNPYLYFQVLFLSGQFEVALEFLSRMKHTLSHAVHVALALYEHNMLLLPPSVNSSLLTQESGDPSPCRRLNLPQLVMKYTKQFSKTDPREALQYFYFLREMRTPSGENLFAMCLSELVIQSNEYKSLLGYIDDKGVRHPGAIDKFQSNTLEIISAVAKANETRGNFEAAAELYDLAMQADRAMEMMIILMAPCVAQQAKPGSDRERIGQFAISLATRYKEGSVESTEYITKSFHLLLDLMTFFTEYHGGYHEKALDTLLQLKLFPSEENDVLTYVSIFNGLHGQIKNCIADILLAYLDILNKLHMREKQQTSVGSPGFGSMSVNLSMSQGTAKSQLYQRYAKAATMFAGNLPYHLPGDTCARLAQMQINMS